MQHNVLGTGGEIEHGNVSAVAIAQRRQDGEEDRTAARGELAFQVQEKGKRADELAAYVSSEPRPGGKPLYEWIQIRQIMEASSSDAE